GRRRVEAGAELRAGIGDGGRGRQLRRDADVDRGAERQVGALERAIDRMYDQVAADDRQAVVGAVEVHVLGAVLVDGDAARDEGVAGGQAGGGRVLADDAQGTR